MLYRDVVAAVVRRRVERKPRLDLIVDKRYTNRGQQLILETTIREAIAEIPQQVVVIQQTDSTARPELQAAGFGAWAFGQKVERGGDRFAAMRWKSPSIDKGLNERR